MGDILARDGGLPETHIFFFGLRILRPHIENSVSSSSFISVLFSKYSMHMNEYGLTVIQKLSGFQP